MRHAFAAWHNGKVLPGCENYANEEGEKWTEQDFPPLLPDLEEARGFMDGAIGQYQQKETILGTSRSFADTGVRISHHVNEKHDFKGPWDTYGKESTDSRRSAVRNRTAVINNAYLHAKHNATAMARPKQVNSEAGRGGTRNGRTRLAALRCPSLTTHHSACSTPARRRRRARRAGATMRPTTTSTTTTGTARTRRASRWLTTTARTTCSSSLP